MQKTIFAFLIIFLFSCHSEGKKEPGNKDTKAELSSTLPYTATYSSKFEMGDAKNAATLLALWKAWDDGNIQAKRDLFADSLSFYSRDGSSMSGKSDSIIAAAQSVRNMYSSVKSTVHAYVPLKSMDQNQSWVCIWGTEVSTDKQGKVDSVGLQETWRFNKNGKIDLAYQFGRALTASAMK
jgi:hypothetical protein